MHQTIICRMSREAKSTLCVVCVGERTRRCLKIACFFNSCTLPQEAALQIKIVVVELAGEHEPNTVWVSHGSRVCFPWGPLLRIWSGACPSRTWRRRRASESACTRLAPREHWCLLCGVYIGPCRSTNLALGIPCFRQRFRVSFSPLQARFSFSHKPPVGPSHPCIQRNGCRVCNASCPERTFREALIMKPPACWASHRHRGSRVGSSRAFRTTGR